MRVLQIVCAILFSLASGTPVLAQQSFHPHSEETDLHPEEADTGHDKPENDRSEERR